MYGKAKRIFCVTVANLVCIGMMSCRSNTINEQQETSAFVESITTSTTESVTAPTTESTTTVLPELDKVYILENGNPDPVPYANENDYIVVENGTHFNFKVGSDATDQGAYFGISIKSHESTLWNPMIYRFPCIEKQLADGNWERLPYLPEDIESIDARWESMQFSLNQPWKTVYFSDIEAESSVGMYRIVLFVCAQTADGVWVNLKYEFPVEVDTLTNPWNPL